MGRRGKELRLGFGGVTVKPSPLVPRVPGSTPGLGISAIYLSSPYTVRWRGVDFKLCLRIDALVAHAQFLVAVCRYKSLTMRYTQARTPTYTHV
jgi:hypothetical protein